MMKCAKTPNPFLELHAKLSVFLPGDYQSKIYLDE